jgi:hypothetical protein
MNMTNKTYEKEVLEKLGEIEKTLIELGDMINSLTRAMRDFFEVSEEGFSMGPELLRNLRFYGDLDTEQYEKPPSPWILKSIESSELDRRTEADFKILGDTETLLPTLKALKSSPNGLTVQEVSKITRRSTSAENDYLRSMFMLGIVDKIKARKSEKYKLGTDKYIPENIKNHL